MTSYRFSLNSQSNASPEAKISVAICAYNASATIETTLNSVFSQTLLPYEILVLDDGSTDHTGAILEGHGSRIRLFRQSNQGIASARNFLCQKATGDMLAFLDADDIWHPSYLKIQQALFKRYPAAVGYFTEHESFVGNGEYYWKFDPLDDLSSSELIYQKLFIRRCNQAPMSFQLSGCCVPAHILQDLGANPFCVSAVEDTYLHLRLALKGPIAHSASRPVAYRISPSSLSVDRLRQSLLIEDAFGLLKEHYTDARNPQLDSAFRVAFAARLRDAAKFLMGVGRKTEARKRLSSSISLTHDPFSLTKSFVLALLTFLPAFCHIRWPARYRRNSL